MNDKEKEKNLCILLKNLVDHFYVREQILKNSIRHVSDDPDATLSFQLLERIEFINDCFPKLSLILSQLGIRDQDFMTAISSYSEKMKEREQLYWKKEFEEIKLPEENEEPPKKKAD